MHTTNINTITIVPWNRETAGEPVPVASNHALETLPERLGPTATLFLHRCGRRFEAGALADFTSYAELATGLGVAPSVIVKTVERVIRFGYAYWADATCELLAVVAHIGQRPTDPTDHLTPPAPHSEQADAA